MKKKKKSGNKREENIILKNKLKERLKNFLKKEKVKDFIIIFIITFFISLIITYSKNIETHKAPGDSFYYYKNAEKFSKVWNNPFYYFSGLLFHNLNNNELYEIGFNYQSDFDSFFRAPLYITYLSLWIAIFGKSELVALLSQIFLLSLLFSMIYLVLRIFTSRIYALAGVFIALIYLPYYVITIQTMSEILQGVLVIILFYYIYLLFIKKKWNKKRYYFLLSFIIILLILSKMSFKYVYFFIIPLIIFYEYLKSKNNKKVLKQNILTFLLSFILILGFYNLITSQDTSNNNVSNLGGWRNYWAGSCLLSDGFGINTGCHVKEFRENTYKSEKKFWFNRYSEISKYAVLDTIKNHPFQYLSMTLKKIGLLLSHSPHNNENVFLLSQLRHSIANKLHIILIFISIFSIFFIKYDKQIFIFVSYYFIILLYLSLLFGLSNPDSRYFSPLIPYYIILSVIGVFYIIKYNFYKKKNYIFYFILILTLVIFLNKNYLNILYSNYYFVKIVQIIIYFLLIILSIFIFKNRKEKEETHYKLFKFIIYIFILSTSIIFILDNKYFNNFSLSITPSDKIEKKIIIKNFPQNIEQSILIIDINQLGNKKLKLTININGKTTNIEPINFRILSKRFGQVNNNDSISPHWIFIPLNKNILKNTNHVAVKANKNYIIYYSYKINKMEQRLPSIFYYKPGINNILFGPKSGKDARCYPLTKIESIKRYSYKNSNRINKDLHIYLLLKDSTDYYINQKYEKFNNAPIKYIALINPIDRRIVIKSKEKLNLPFIKIYNNLYRYIAGEIDRFESGYHFY